MLAAGSSYGCWRWYLIHKSNWDIVVPGQIYRSAQVSRFLIREKLEQNKIAVIVSLLGNSKNDADVDVEIKTANEMGISFTQFPMDGDGIPMESEGGLHVLHPGGGRARPRYPARPVLVQTSRTPNLIRCAGRNARER